MKLFAIVGAVHVSSSSTKEVLFNFLTKRCRLSLPMICTVRMHNLELTQQRIENKSTIQNNHVDADGFSRVETREQKIQQRHDQDEQQEDDAVFSKCTFACLQ